MSLGYQYTFNVPSVAAVSAAVAAVVWTQYYVITDAFDPAEYTGATSYKLVVVMQTTLNTAYARLYNVTDATVIGQATTTGTTPTLAESAALTMPATAKTLRVDFGTVSGDGPVYCYSAKVRVDF